jgi:hypothetical protein
MSTGHSRETIHTRNILEDLYHMLYVGSVIGIMTWLLAGGSEVHLMADGKKLLPPPKSPEWLWNAKILLLNG